MSELTAQFELQLLDRMSGPLREVLDRIESLNRVLSQFDGTGNEAASTTQQLDEALRGTTAGADAVSEALARTNSVLGETGAAGHEAGDGLHSVETGLTGVEERATTTLGVMGRLRETMNGIGGNLGGALHGFHEKWGAAQGRGFGALVSGFELVEPVEQAAEFDNNLTHVGIGLQQHGDALKEFVANEKLFIDRTARETGQLGTKLAEAEFFLSSEGYRGDRLHSVIPTVARISTAYNADPQEVAKTAFALHENLGIADGEDLNGALASLAVAGKQAHIPFEELAQQFPELATGAAGLGLKGRGSVDDIMAMLAVARKSSGSLQKAVTDTRQFFTDLNQPTATKELTRFGINSFAIQQNALAHHEDPVIAVLDAVRKVAVNQDGSLRADVIGTLFRNHEAKNFVQAMLMHPDEYQRINQKLHGAGGSELDADYQSGRGTLLIQVQEFHEAIGQLMRRLGDDFAPTLHLVTVAVDGVNQAFEWMDKALPGVSPVLIGAVGAFLGLTTVLAAAGAVSTAVSAGFGVLAAVLGVLSWPVVLVVAGITAVGVALYECWKHWDRIKVVLNGAGQAVVDFINRVINAIPAALRGAWGHVVNGATAVGHAVSNVLHPHGPEAAQPGQIGPDGKWRFAPSPEEKFRIENHLNNHVTVTHPGLPSGFHEAIGRLKGVGPANDNPVQKVAMPLPPAHPVLPELPHGNLVQMKQVAGGATAKAVPPPVQLPGVVPGIHAAIGQLKRPAIFQTKPAAAAQPVLAPVVQRKEEPAAAPTPSRIHLYVHADEGLKVRAESQNNQPLDVHVHGGLNSMMGRP